MHGCGGSGWASSLWRTSLPELAWQCSCQDLYSWVLCGNALKWHVQLDFSTKRMPMLCQVAVAGFGMLWEAVWWLFSLLNTEAKKAPPCLAGWTTRFFWHLCFRKSTMSDGPRPQEFHVHSASSQGSNGGPVAQLTTGKVIGGYTPLSWKGTERFEEEILPEAASCSPSPTNSSIPWLRIHQVIYCGSPGWKYAIRPSVHYGPIMGWSYDFKWSRYEGTIHNRVKLGWSCQCRIGGKNMQNCQNDFAGSAEKWGVTEWEMYYHSWAMKIETGWAQFLSGQNGQWFSLCHLGLLTVMHVFVLLCL